MKKLRSFCATSLILVIYHAEASEGEPGRVGAIDPREKRGAVATPAPSPDPDLDSEVRGSDAASTLCSTGGGGFFDGWISFATDGRVTFDAAAKSCP